MQVNEETSKATGKIVLSIIRKEEIQKREPSILIMALKPY